MIFWTVRYTNTQIQIRKYTNTQIQHMTKSPKYPTHAIFLNNWWFKDVKNDNPKYSDPRYTVDFCTVPPGLFVSAITDTFSNKKMGVNFFFYYTRYGKSCQQYSELAANRPPTVSFVPGVIRRVSVPEPCISKEIQTEWSVVGFRMRPKSISKILSGFSALLGSCDFCSRKTGLERMLRFNQVPP